MLHAFTVFAYPNNAAMACPCVRAIRWLRPDSPVTVAVDGDGGDYPADARIVRTTFNRRRNLNGGDAILGVLDTLIASAESAKADWVWKMDPDTILLNDAVLNMGHADAAGYACPGNRAGLSHPGLCLLGCCYGLRLDLARRVRDFWRKMPIQDCMAEDVAITGAAHAFSAMRHALPVNQTLPYAMHFWRWADPLPIERYRTASAVNLGNPGGTPEAQAALATRLIDQMPPVAAKAQETPKPHRQHPDEVARRVALPCAKRVAGRCTQCSTCRGEPMCESIAAWKPCPEGLW